MSFLTAAFKPLLEAVLPDGHLDALAWAHHWHGAPAAVRSYTGLVARRDGLLSIETPDTRRPVFIRPGVADRTVFDQVFHDREYDLDLHLDSGAPQTIVDAGANIGLASALLASRYPGARILAIEPESANYALLRRNAAPYANVRPVQAGLWSHAAHLAIENPEEEPWGFRVVETDGPSGLAAIGVEDAMRLLDTDRIDVLKLDIEGAECAVLGACDAWIGRVQTVIVELHPWAQPCGEEAVARLVERHDFRRTQRGENVVLRRP